MGQMESTSYLNEAFTGTSRYNYANRERTQNVGKAKIEDSKSR
jgi:hypothetical protein